MDLRVTFPVRFDVRTLKDGVSELMAATGATKVSYWNMEVTRGTETWGHSDVYEFYEDFSKPYDSFSIAINVAVEDAPEVLSSMSIEGQGLSLPTAVKVYNSTRPVISQTMQIFRDAAPFMPPVTPAPVQPRIFIGHGGSSGQWRLLADHLRDHHGYDVMTYETGARAGHTIRDVLEELMLDRDFALLVMTGEDELADGSMRARQNVVHEAGLFQGRLGFRRAIVVLEEGVDNFSNLDGIQYVPFKTENIREAFGDVVATLRREFPSPKAIEGGTHGTGSIPHTPRKGAAAPP